MAAADVARPFAPAGPSVSDNIRPVQTKNTKHDVLTTMNYYLAASDGSPPAPQYVDRPETYERPVFPLQVTVHDITGNEDKYTLDGNGFQIVKHESGEKEFLDDEKIKREYYAETEQLLKGVTGATKIFIFDHTIRRQKKDERERGAANSSTSLRGPVKRVHIDQSYEASVQRVHHHLPEEADELLKGRFQIINVWRPIRPILADPLAVADAYSVPDSDLVSVPLIYPNRKGATYTVKPNEKHKWYFKYAQKPDEVTLIKCYDSREDVARRVPHSAFEDAAEKDRDGRESIEVRALVFSSLD